jgi:hypothetical protein
MGRIHGPDVVPVVVDVLPRVIVAAIVVWAHTVGVVCRMTA